MTEVIELLSSSSPPRPVSRNGVPMSIVTGKASPRKNCHHLDDFDETASSVSKGGRPTKRIRLNPVAVSIPRIDTGSAAIQRAPLLKFDFFSDEEEFLNDPKSKAITSTSIRGSSRHKAQIDDQLLSSSPVRESGKMEKTDQHAVKPTGKFLSDDFFDDDYLLDDIPTRSPPAGSGYDRRTANLLASLTQESVGHEESRSRDATAKTNQDHIKRKVTAKALDEIEFSSPARPKPSKPAKLTEAEKFARAAERAAHRATVKAQKDDAKQAEKTRKIVKKEEKEREKQKAADLAEVNKSRTNKKDATPEMILDISSFLKGTSVGNQLEQRMANMQVEVHYIDEEINLMDDEFQQEQYGSIVTWRRKVKSVYNDEEGLWEPTSSCRINKEKHVLIHLTAVDFAAVAAVSRADSYASILRTETEMKANLDSHVASVRRRFRDCVPIYLIEGLRGWLKKNSNARNRTYTAAVRAQMLPADADVDPAVSQTRVRKRKKPTAESLDLSHVTTDVADDLLLHLQLAHQPVLIHQTVTPTESASQISALTQHLSTRPYRLAQLDYNLKSASFCMDSGQVRTGDDTKDTFVKMLQEVQRVTPSMAQGIVNEYETVRQLVKGFDKHGNLLLEDVRKALNADGGWSDKRLGPQVSKRLFKVFMGRDPAATDGMS